MVEPISIAPHAVLCFFQDVIAGVVERDGGRIVDHVVSEIGRNPIYEIDHGGRRLVVMHPGVGAPLAAGFLEELIARGCRTFVACGGAGVLVPDVAVGHVIVPTAAVRDEGTSYHYLPASRTVEPSSLAVDAIVATAERHGVPHVRGSTWTIDAFYRETRGKVDARVREVPHGRDGGGGFLRRRGVSRSDVRPGALRGGRPLRRRVGPARLGRAHDRTRDRVPHRGRGGAHAGTRLTADAARELSVRALRYPAPHGDRGDDRRPHVPVGAADRGVRAQRRRWGCTGSSGTTAPTTTSDVPAELLDPSARVDARDRGALRRRSARAVAIVAESWWLLAVAAVLVLVGWVGFLHTGRRVITAQEQAGVEPSSAGLALFLYIVVAFLGGSYLQAGLNRAWKEAAGDERERLAAAAAGAGARAREAVPRPAPKSGTNLVTPEDVGSRVTFQFELPNGFTAEAVGVFERWDQDAETYFVRKKDGTEVGAGARRAPRQGHPRSAGTT